MHNIAFELFLDIVELLTKMNHVEMRYSPSTLQFVWLGRKIFGGRFIRFMSGPKMKVTFYQDLQRRIGVETRLKGYKYFEIERDFFNKLGVLIDGDFKLVYCYLFLFVSLAVIQAIYIEMVFCKESMSVPFSSFP